MTLATGTAIKGSRPDGAAPGNDAKSLAGATTHRDPWAPGRHCRLKPGLR
jgi:hypothetical protein